MKYEIYLRLIELLFQFLIVIFAGFALFVWKKEIRGKERYQLAKNILNYVKELSFWIHTKNGSLHQIFLNDIIVNRKDFYNNQLFLVSKERFYFSESVWGLFHHINVRADIFLPKKIRKSLEELTPLYSKRAEFYKGECTYIEVRGVETIKPVKIGEDEPKGDVYTVNKLDGLSIEDYFKKWEKLIIELQKLT